jgi:hypothetical protein
MNYTITLNRVNEYDLVVSYNEDFKAMSPEDFAVALEDCINTLKTELLLVQQS